MGIICIKDRKIPTEFLLYILKKGITELKLKHCEILPPRVPRAKLSKSMGLKTLIIDLTVVDETLVEEMISSRSIEKLALRDCSNTNLPLIPRNLSRIGWKLKTLNLGNLLRYGKKYYLRSTSLIVNSCINLEELNLCCNSFSTDAVEYLCENLTPTILKLDLKTIQYASYDKNLRMGLPDELARKVGLTDKNLGALVKRCPKLRVLDIRDNDNVTYQGLLAISNGLHFLEYLGLPTSVGIEFGLPQFTWIEFPVSKFQMLPYTLQVHKMQPLKLMKTLKEISLSHEMPYPEELQSLLRKEIPQLFLEQSDDSSESNFT